VYSLRHSYLMYSIMQTPGTYGKQRLGPVDDCVKQLKESRSIYKGEGGKTENGHVSVTACNNSCDTCCNVKYM